MQQQRAAPRPSPSHHPLSAHAFVLPGPPFILSSPLGAEAGGAHTVARAHDDTHTHVKKKKKKKSENGHTYATQHMLECRLNTHE